MIHETAQITNTHTHNYYTVDNQNRVDSKLTITFEDAEITQRSSVNVRHENRQRISFIVQSFCN